MNYDRHTPNNCAQCIAYALEDPSAHCHRCNCEVCSPARPERVTGTPVWNGLTVLGEDILAHFAELRGKERRFKKWQQPPVNSCPTDLPAGFDFVGLLPPGVDQAGHNWPRYIEGMFDPFITAVRALNYSVCHTHLHTLHRALC
jgi:hypothetical protein